MSVSNKVAVVTGAGQSVGLGIAQTLAAAGAKVVVNDIFPDRAGTAVQSITEAGGEAVAAPFDVTDYQAVKTGLETVERDLGSIDVLVHNAGIPPNADSSLFAESTPESWRPYVDVNLYGALNCAHAVLPGMRARKWGRIIQISSGAAAMATNTRSTLYAAGKAGAEGALRHIAAEVGADAITVNTLSLGLMENVAPAIGANVSPELDAIWALNLVKRLGTGQDVGAACLWLASEAGEYVTGQTIHLNGGGYFGR